MELQDLQKDGTVNEYLTDRLTTEALKFIGSDAGEPFFLYLSHYALNTPLQAKLSDVSYFETKASDLPIDSAELFQAEMHNSIFRKVQNHPTYAAMIKSVDESVGRAEVFYKNMIWRIIR